MWNNYRSNRYNIMIDLFKEKGIKLTKQRKLVYEVIKDETTFDEIKYKCSKYMNNSTIYRIIELFLKNEMITKNIDNNGNICYSINEGHKHYIYCVKCHKKTSINICPIENLENSGYKLLSHQITINGICDNCQKNKA